MEQIGGVKLSIRVRGTQFSFEKDSVNTLHQANSPGRKKGNYNIVTNISGRADRCRGSISVTLTPTQVPL